MGALACLLLLTGVYPLGCAFLANRRTTLISAVAWAVAAWVGWSTLPAVALCGGQTVSLQTARYLALCLTACAMVAVLGARRPGVGAWNFVVLGLLAVMLLPLLERLVAGAQAPGVVRAVFLVATLAVGVLNYLPTRLAPAAILLGLGCAGEVLVLLAEAEARQRLGDLEPLCWLALGLVPWTAYLGWRRRPRPASELDRLWLDFRDRFGLFWGQRLREQFNCASANAGWPASLSWQGMHLNAGASADEQMRVALLHLLRALLKRFLPADGDAGTAP